MSKHNPKDGMEEGCRVVAGALCYFPKEGTTGTLEHDDGSDCPKFKWDNTKVTSYEHLRNVKLLRLNDAKPSEWNSATKKTVTMPKPALNTIGWRDSWDKDVVDSPAHYNNGGIECIDYIRQQLGEEGYIAYCEGNVLKYQHRYKYKGGLEDLKKAQKYQEWLIEAVEAKQEVVMTEMKQRNL